MGYSDFIQYVYNEALTIFYAMHKLYKIYWSGNKVKDKKQAFRKELPRKEDGLFYKRGGGGEPQSFPGLVKEN